VSSADVLRDELTRHIEAGRQRVVVDLSGLTFIDSTGLGVLVSARALLVSRHGRLDLVAGGRVHRLLRMSALVSLFPVHGTPEEAIEACRT
jgi:anti-sigma B factor antagonist